MESKIIQLPDTIANQIKAGEVVNRPASVVKELMENAVDAEAQSVTVNIRGGGKDLVQVIDDGCGMSAEDALKAFDRHATSKLRSVDDLFHLTTFGFRGEALASISSVAEVELRTRRHDDELGVSLNVNGGEKNELQPIMIAPGTQLSVKNLFYNVPARRKFLKKDSSEAERVIDEFQRVALCNPQVEFTLFNNDSRVYQLPKANLRQRIAAVMGKSVNSALLAVDVSTSIVNIHGFVGHPHSARKTRIEQFLFVNGRFFRSASLHKAISKAYENILKPELSPAYFLYFEVDPQRLDVNVHPQKTEVKFEDEASVWQILNAAVRESLAKLGAVSLMDFDAEDQIEIPAINENETQPCKVPSNFIDETFNPFAAESNATSSTKPAWGHEYSRRLQDSQNWDSLYDKFEKCEPMPAGEFNDTEAVYDDETAWGAVHTEDSGLDFDIETVTQPRQQALEFDSSTCTADILRLGAGRVAVYLPEGLTIIDLIRAKERLLYDHFSGCLRDETPVIQHSLFPQTIELQPQDYSIFCAIQSELQQMGMDVTDSGDNCITLRGIPADTDASQALEMLHGIFADLREGEVVTSLTRSERVAMSMSRIANRGTARELTDSEAQRIVNEIVNSPQRGFTADGRSILFVLSDDELGKRLK